MRSKKITSRKNAPPPAVQSNKPSIMGNIIGGMSSGFGFGTGIEAARGIFGGQQRQISTTPVNENQNNCEMLFKLIESCKKKDNYTDLDNNCDMLISKFTDVCINK